MFFTTSIIGDLFILLYLGLGIYLNHRAYKSDTKFRFLIALIFTVPAIIYYLCYTIYIVFMALFIGNDELFDDNHLFKKDKPAERDTE